MSRLPRGQRLLIHGRVNPNQPGDMFPDVNFLVYHAGYVQTAKEGPYDPARGDGVDRLIRSVEEAGLGLTAELQHPQTGGCTKGAAALTMVLR